MSWLLKYLMDSKMKAEVDKSLAKKTIRSRALRLSIEASNFASTAAQYCDGGTYIDFEMMADALARLELAIEDYRSRIDKLEGLLDEKKRILKETA